MPLQYTITVFYLFEAKNQNNIIVSLTYDKYFAGSSDKEQLTYTETRLRDLENVKEVKNINPILRVFTGDTPARQFESGQQRGGKFS